MARNGAKVCQKQNEEFSKNNQAAISGMFLTFTKAAKKPAKR